MKRDAADILRDRVHAAIPQKFKHISEVAEKAGIHQGNFSDFMNRKRKSVNLETAWKLFTVLGPSYDEAAATIQRMGAQLPKLVQPEAHDIQGHGLTTLGVYAVAGAGPAWEAEEAEPIFRIAVPAYFLRPHITPLFIRGTSMEPTILDQAIVGVNRESGEIVQGKIYAVRLPYEGIVVKRLFIDHEKHAFVLRSDNKNGDHQDIRMSFDEGDTFIYGQVIWVLQSYEKIAV